MFSNGSQRKKTGVLVSALILILAAGCAQNPPQGGAPLGGDASPAKPSHLSEGTPAFTYPESAANGWTGTCLLSAPATNPRQPPPAVQQSPIDFTSISPTPGSAKVNVFVPGAFDPHDNNLVFASVLSMTQSSESTFSPLSFHFHSPVEHVLPAVTGPGLSAPQLEIHIKAADKYGKVSVFAVQYQANSAVTVNSETLQTLTNIMAAGTQNYQAVSLYNTLYLFRLRPFYSYVGSLTTPPCTTGVQFYVAKMPQQIPPSQMTTVLTALRRAGMPSNNYRVPQQIASPAPTITLFTPASN